MTQRVSIVTIESFKILRLRLLRPPPVWIDLSKCVRESVSVEFDLALGIQDDYGIDVLDFDDIQLSLTVLDSETLNIVPHTSVTINGGTEYSTFTITTSIGPFYPLRVRLNIKKGTQPPPAIRFLVSAQSGIAKNLVILSDDSRSVLRLLGEQCQMPVQSWSEDHSYVFLRVTSGDVKTSKDQAEDTLVASSKVQTAFRQLHLSDDSRISILERPGLNNSTGQRLWDCAIAMTCFFSRNPQHILPPPTTDSRPTKKARRSEKTSLDRAVIIELGAGCALASLAISRILATSGLQDQYEYRILATDIEATVETILRENLVVNACSPDIGCKVEGRVLDWGILEKDRILEVLRTPTSSQTIKNEAPHLTIVGTDILYNPSSHQLLLDTLLSFFTATDFFETYQALIAYKHRTEGDADFFEMARKRGMIVEKVWEWGDVAVHRFTMSVKNET